jgi:hypothetical protein
MCQYHVVFCIREAGSPGKGAHENEYDIERVLGEASYAKGIISKELTVGSKTVPTTFFVVDVKVKYNVLLGQDWIHANDCVPSTLHQCVVHWIGDEVEVIGADNSVYVAMAKPQEDLQDREVKCMTRRDLSEYDFNSVGRDVFVLVIVKPMTLNQLENMKVKQCRT